MKTTHILLITALMLLSAVVASAQNTMRVHLEDGTVAEYSISSIKHIDWYEKEADTHEYVDLGLSVKWATCNVGATNPQDYGDYFAWGETSPKESYTWSNLKYCTSYDTQKLEFTFSKYVASSSYGTVDNKTTLEPEDDAAHVNWGGDWRMPTYAEQMELRDNCYWEWTTNYNNTSGYIVYKAKDDADKGKHPYWDYDKESYIIPTPTATYSLSDTHIFLPAAGYRGDTYLSNVGSYGTYWSSSLDSSDSDDAYNLYFNSGGVDWLGYGRYRGRSVRPVCP